MIAGAQRPEEAKARVEYVMGAKAQDAGLDVGVYTVPSATGAQIGPDAPALADVNLVDDDFDTCGASDTRERLRARWEAEVKGAGGRSRNSRPRAPYGPGLDHPRRRRARRWARPSHERHPMTRTATLWTINGLATWAALSWYAVQGGILSSGWLGDPFAAGASGLSAAQGRSCPPRRAGGGCSGRDWRCSPRWRSRAARRPGRDC